MILIEISFILLINRQTRKHTVYITFILPNKASKLSFFHGVIPAFQQGITTVWNP